MKSTETDISQRFPISSILFLFFNVSLIKKYIKVKLKLQIKDFVNDIHLLTYNKFTKFNYLILKRAHEIYLRWAITHDVIFALKKYKLIYLTRSPRRFDISITINLKILITKLKANIRILGLYIDDKFH